MPATEALVQAASTETAGFTEATDARHGASSSQHNASRKERSMTHLPRRIKLITLAMALALGSLAVSAAATSVAHADAHHSLSMMRSIPPDPI